MKFQKLGSKLRKEKKLARRIGGVFGAALALIMAASIFPAPQAEALDVDLSDAWFTLFAQNPADLIHPGSCTVNLDSSGWCALGIKDNGASNHKAACATHNMYSHSTGLDDDNMGLARFHPKSSKSYAGKYGNRAYTLMDDSFGNANTFKMLEVTDKSGDPGKQLRGTSKFYSGSDPWQRFEFEFVGNAGDFSNYQVIWGKNDLYNWAQIYKVHMRSEKTGNYIVADGVNNGASMHVANPGDNIDLYMIVWQTW